MIKVLLFGFVATVLAFLGAGAVSELVFRNGNEASSDPKSRDADIEKRYGICLGGGIFFAMTVSSVYSASTGYYLVSALYFCVAALGAVSAVLRFRQLHAEDMSAVGENEKNDGGNAVIDSAQRHKNGKALENGEKNEECRKNDGFACRCFENDGEKANNSGGNDITSVLKRVFLSHPVKKAVFFGVLFIVSIVVLCVFEIFSLGHVIDEGDIYSDEVVFEGYEQGGNAIFLTAKQGSEAYALFGYALQGGVDGLLEKIDGEQSFTVRYTVMERDEWGGYFCLLSATDGEGVICLDEETVIAARERARTEKCVILCAIAIACCFACGCYTVAALRRVRPAANYGGSGGQTPTSA